MACRWAAWSIQSAASSLDAEGIHSTKNINHSPDERENGVLKRLRGRESANFPFAVAKLFVADRHLDAVILGPISGAKIPQNSTRIVIEFHRRDRDRRVSSMSVGRGRLCSYRHSTHATVSTKRNGPAKAATQGSVIRIFSAAERPRWMVLPATSTMTSPASA